MTAPLTLGVIAERVGAEPALDGAVIPYFDDSVRVEGVGLVIDWDDQDGVEPGWAYRRATALYSWGEWVSSDSDALDTLDDLVEVVRKAVAVATETAWDYRE